MSTFISIKPLSVNECWQGQRVKTAKYRSYELDVLVRLPEMILPPPPYRLYLEFGMHNVMSDWDNPVKPFQDILQKKYNFNDRLVMKAVVLKKKVKKGEDYVLFEIQTFKQ